MHQSHQNKLLSAGFTLYHGTLRDNKPVIQVKTKERKTWHTLEKDFASVAACKRRLAELDKNPKWIDLHDTKNGLQDPGYPALQPSGFLEHLSHEFEAIRQSSISAEEATRLIGGLRERGAGFIITDDLDPVQLKPLPTQFQSKTGYPASWPDVPATNLGLEMTLAKDILSRPLIDDTQDDIIDASLLRKMVQNAATSAEKSQKAMDKLRELAKVQWMIEPMKPFLNWIFVNDVTPDPFTVVLGFHPTWISTEFAPSGIRECFIDRTGNWILNPWINEEPESANDIPPHQWLDYSNILPERP